MGKSSSGSNWMGNSRVFVEAVYAYPSQRSTNLAPDNSLSGVWCTDVNAVAIHQTILENGLVWHRDYDIASLTPSDILDLAYADETRSTTDRQGYKGQKAPDFDLEGCGSELTQGCFVGKLQGT